MTPANNTQDQPICHHNPTWSPDGTKIAYLYEDGDGLGVWTMDADG